MDELKEIDSSLQKHFEMEFERWAERYSPTGDNTALKAIAWYWFLRGSGAATRVIASAIEKNAIKTLELSRSMRGEGY